MGSCIFIASHMNLNKPTAICHVNCMQNMKLIASAVHEMSDLDF